MIKVSVIVPVYNVEKYLNALKLMALMGMGIKQGDTVKVTVEGADEDTAAALGILEIVINEVHHRIYSAVGNATVTKEMLHEIRESKSLGNGKEQGQDGDDGE